MEPLKVTKDVLGNLFVAAPPEVKEQVEQIMMEYMTEERAWINGKIVEYRINVPGNMTPELIAKLNEKLKSVDVSNLE